MTTTRQAQAINKAFDATIKSSLAAFTELVEQNAKLWEPDQYPSQFVTVIEDEIIPALEAIENYDPTPDTPYDFFHQ